MKRLSSGIRWAIALSALVLLCSCAGVTQRGDSSEAALKSRVEEFWRLRLAGKHAETYPLEWPGYRETTSLTVYVMKYGGSGDLLAAKVESVSVDGDHGSASVTIRYRITGGYMPQKGVTRTIGDYWRRFDGQWYHVLNPPKSEKVKPLPQDYDKMREQSGIPVPPRAKQQQAQ